MFWDRYLQKKLSRESQLIYRLILLFIALFYALLGIFHRTADVETTMADDVRNIIGFLYMGFYLLTYLKSLRRYLYAFVCTVSFIGIFHLVYMGYLRQFTGNYTFTILVVIFLFNLIFKSGLLLRMYNIGFNLFLIVLVVMSPEADINRLLFIISALFLSITSYIISYLRKRSEEELRTSKKEYKNLFVESPIGLLKVDTRGRILDINNRMICMLGISRDLKKEKLQELAGFEDVVELWENNRDRFGKGESLSGEIKYSHYPGEQCWFDYNVKPISKSDGELEELIISCRDITERKKAEEKIKYFTFHDSVTGLYNRTYFEEELKRYNTERQLPLSLIIGDVNGLKLTNDAFGHKKGDELLQKVAEVMDSQSRQEDLVARWGGDEFVLLLPETDETAAAAIGKRIKTAVEELDIEPVSPSVALGYATKVNPDRDIWIVFEEAEEMMYSNKIKESKEVHRNIISVLKELLERNTSETPEHCCQIKEMALEIGNILGLSEEIIERVKLLAEYHDLGKVSAVISETRKNRSGDEERHMEIGYQIASSCSCLTNIAEGILAHHENWDGTGKPRGLKGEEIPLIARIIAPVDHYVFLTLNKGNKKEKARQIIDDRAGNKYDPEIVDIFLNQVLD